jgi:hypothetical protein
MLDGRFPDFLCSSEGGLKEKAETVVPAAVALLVARLEVVPTGVSQCKVPKILMLNFK